jgi:nucleotide-binding universal stress UspA family protein
MDEGCDLIIVGSHGRGAVGRILLGSDSLKVLTLSTVAVLVCR